MDCQVSFTITNYDWTAFNHHKTTKNHHQPSISDPHLVYRVPRSWGSSAFPQASGTQRRRFQRLGSGMNWIRDVFSELDSSGDGTVTLKEFENQLFLGLTRALANQGAAAVAAMTPITS